MNKRTMRRLTVADLVIVVAALVAVAALGVRAVTSVGRDDSEQLLRLLCANGQKSLDAYFESVEQSVDMVVAYVESDLETTPEGGLPSHLERVSAIFQTMAEKTEGVLTYYYRIDPAVADEVGFWFVEQSGARFVEHQVTDISAYDTSDTEHLVWFTIPKATGSPVWLDPYVTDNLDAEVVSYNVPIFWRDTFLGVFGIEIDYATLTSLVVELTLYDSGFAYLTNADGDLLYHPHIDVSDRQGELQAPAGPADELQRYSFGGVEHQAAWLPTANGMRLYVTVPSSELSATWKRWANLVIAISIGLLALVTMLITFLRHLVLEAPGHEAERRQLSEQLRSSAELTKLMGQTSSLLTNMPAMSFSKDAETGVYLACNQLFAAYAGKGRPDDIVGLTDWDIFDEATAAHFVADDARALSMDEPLILFEDAPDASVRVVRSLQTTKQRFTDATGRQCLLGMCVDVTEAIRAKATEAAMLVRQEEERRKHALEASWRADLERLSWQATHDELTGLLNRTGFDELQRTLELSQTYFLMIDIDDFKSANDTYGHDVGDRVLMRVAETLRRHFRTDDLICRLGGDEFVVAMVNVRTDFSVVVAAKAEALNRELSVADDIGPAVSVSMGITHGSEAQSVSGALELADQAMYASNNSFPYPEPMRGRP